MKLKTIQEQSEIDNSFNSNLQNSSIKDQKVKNKSPSQNSYHSSTAFVTPEQVINRVSNVAKLILQSKEDDIFRFNILGYKDKKISNVFKACDELVNSQSIDSYEINEMNLEDVFLVCCAGEKEGMESIA